MDGPPLRHDSVDNEAPPPSFSTTVPMEEYSTKSYESVKEVGHETASSLDYERTHAPTVPSSDFVADLKPPAKPPVLVDMSQSLQLPRATAVKKKSIVDDWNVERELQGDFFFLIEDAATLLASTEFIVPP